MKGVLFDAFFCYNSEDENQIMQIANELKELGLNIWLDKWHLDSCKNWVEGLYQGMSDSKSIIIFVGSSGIGPWQKIEVNNALIKFVSEGKSFIPVILPGVDNPPKLPTFLGQFQWIDCRTIQCKMCLDKLILWVTGREIKRSISQIGTEFKLGLQKPFQKERDIKIYTLPNQDSSELLNLTWETFGKGIEKLRDQIKNYGFRIPIDACFGINDAGLVIATFLNSNVMDRAKIGYIRYKGSKEGQIVSDEGSFFPGLNQTPTIMLVDFEVKSGKGLEIAIKRIRQEYPGAIIYFSVFGALTEEDDLKINCFDDLKAAGTIKKIGISDIFIACTMHRPGIEPRLELR